MTEFRTPINIEVGAPGRGQPATVQGEAPLSHEYYDYNRFGFIDTDEFSDLTLAQELRYFDGLRKFYTFLDYNAAIGSYRQMVADLASTVEWRVRPALPPEYLPSADDDEPPEPTPEAVAAAVFVKKALRSLTVERPWKIIISEAMTAPVYGCAIFEISYRKEGNNWYWYDFGFRSRSSIKAIITDPKTRNFMGLRQRIRKGKDAILSKERLVILRHQPEFGILGRSVFQTAYSAIRRQNEMETLIINVLRGALAKPDILRPIRAGAEATKAPPDIFNGKDSAAAQTVKSVLEMLTKCHRVSELPG